MKKILTYGITLLLLGMIIIPSIRTNEVEYSLITVGKIILYVGGNGPGNYTKIQYAIDNASDGDLVFVYDDSSPYFENLVVNVTIDLTSEDRYTTIIDGCENDNVIQINAVSVKINGFKIINGNFGIWYNSSSNNTITNCSIYSNSYHGIRLTSSSNNTITNCSIYNNSFYGIKLISSSNNTITNCSIYSNSHNGFRLWRSSSNNTITNCSINSNSINGIDIEVSSNDNLISNCTINNNTITGIWIFSSSNNTITNCSIYNNSFYGIKLISSSNNAIKNCFIYNSSLYGIKIISSAIDNLIYNNYFNNIHNAQDECNNIWNISKTSQVNILGGNFSGGNYWSDYNGVDINGDGLGDTNLPHNSSGYIIYGGDWIPLVVNNPPYIPTNPNPDNGEDCVVINTNLSWMGGDPDPYDNVTYDVYFGNTTPPPQVAWNQTEITFNPLILEYNTSYYWYIVAWDNHGSSTAGPEWHFTTEEINHPPNPPSISGTIMGKVGASYPYTFTSTDPEGDEIWYYIEWGDDLYEEWIGPYSSEQNITISHKWNEQGKFSIRAKAKDIFDEESNWSYLEITMPLNQPIQHYIFSFFQHLFDRFPNAFPIFRHLLDM